MKAKLKGKITAMREVPDRRNRDGDPDSHDCLDSHDYRPGSLVSISVQPKGTVTDVKGPDAKRVETSMTILVKPLVAQGLKFGQELFISISTEEES